MSDTGLTVPCMTEPPRRYDVTITVDRDSGHIPTQPSSPRRPSRVASARAASTVTVLAADQPAAVTVALAVVTDALRRPVASPTR